MEKIKFTEVLGADADRQACRWIFKSIWSGS